MFLSDHLSTYIITYPAMSNSLICTSFHYAHSITLISHWPPGGGARCRPTNDKGKEREKNREVCLAEPTRLAMPHRFRDMHRYPVCAVEVSFVVRTRTSSFFGFAFFG